LEETALAVAALAAWSQTPPTRMAFFRGTEYLIRGARPLEDRPAPIGLYFAHLWYSEELYPLIWALDALGRALKIVYPLPGGVRPPATGSRLRAI